jgi:ribonucleoside-diphosphate reductase alpha chain
MMDCDTTGIEPDLGLVKFKKLVGGGNMTIVNQTVPRALVRLGYEGPVVERITAYIDEHKTIVGSPDLRAEHLAAFACSMGDNVIHYEGHVRMMGAVQPFLSGAISKTVNMPETATVEDIEQIHMLSWELGLKAVAIYRDNCKVGQPLSTMKKDGASGSKDADGADASVPGGLAMERTIEKVVERIVHQPVRQKLPRSRRGRTFEFRVADCKGFATIGEYADGRPGEVFLTVSKQGSTLAGIMDAFAKSISYGLQYGVPLRAFIEAFVNTRFEPAGMTDDPDIRMASSIVDYLFRRLAVEYLSPAERAELGVYTREERMQPTLPGVEESVTESAQGADAVADPKTIPSASELAAEMAATSSAHARTGMICSACGSANMRRAGACHVCGDCGTTSGCS